MSDDRVLVDAGGVILHDGYCRRGRITSHYTVSPGLSRLGTRSAVARRQDAGLSLTVLPMPRHAGASS